MPVKTGIQVTDSVRDTVGKQYPGGWWVWIPAPDRVRGKLCAGMTD